MAAQPERFSNSASERSNDPEGTRPLVLLHLCGLKVGQLASDDGSWAPARFAFLKELQEQAAHHGAPDIIVFTGDLAFSGKRDQYAQVQTELREIMAAVGGSPVIVTIPGNHDLDRSLVASDAPLLDPFFSDPTFQAHVKAGTSDAAKDIFERAFAAYMDFFRAHIVSTWGAAPNYQLGKVPGAYTLRIQRKGWTLGIAGMNSALLQLSGDPVGETQPYRGKLALGSWQLADSDVASWSAGQDASLLLMHHPVEWLEQSFRTAFAPTLYVPGGFRASLSGHRVEELHANAVASSLQAPALLKRDWAETSLTRREIGYSWICLKRDKAGQVAITLAWRTGDLSNGKHWEYHSRPNSPFPLVSLNPPHPAQADQLTTDAAKAKAKKEGWRRGIVVGIFVGAFGTELVRDFIRLVVLSVAPLIGLSSCPPPHPQLPTSLQDPDLTSRRRSQDDTIQAPDAPWREPSLPRSPAMYPVRPATSPPEIKRAFDTSAKSHPLDLGQHAPDLAAAPQSPKTPLGSGN